MLRALRLPAIAAVYEDLALKVAKANLTHEEFLYELLRAECLQRDEHRVARLQRLSGLPPDKTFRTLQLDRFPPLIRQQLERLRSGTFLDDAINVVAAGKPGVGKASDVVNRTTFSAVPWASAATALNVNNPSCSPTSSNWR